MTFFEDKKITLSIRETKHINVMIFSLRFHKCTARKTNFRYFGVTKRVVTLHDFAANWFESCSQIKQNFKREPKLQ